MELKGKVIESNKACNKKAYVYPIPHYYAKRGKTHVKYDCPVCDALGNKHTVEFGENNCMLCGVNLSWDKQNDLYNSTPSCHSVRIREKNSGKKHISIFEFEEEYDEI